MHDSVSTDKARDGAEVRQVLTEHDHGPGRRVGSESRSTTAAVEIGRSPNSHRLEQVGLAALMAHSQGSPRIIVALIDGPVQTEIGALVRTPIRSLRSSPGCRIPSSAACEHGTFVAAMLAASRDSFAPGICPGCTFLNYEIFQEFGRNGVAITAAAKLAVAIVEAVQAGAHVINLSVSILGALAPRDRDLEAALGLATKRGALVVAAAGNDRMIGSSPLTLDHWVIPVAACDESGRPLERSNLSGTIGRGLTAPGASVVSLRPDGDVVSLTGTSAAAPFVSGAIALLWSEYPNVTATAMRRALLHSHESRRAGIVPPLLDAQGALEHLRERYSVRSICDLGDRND